MLDQALDGGFANPPADASRAFRAAMTAMARPGTLQTVEDVNQAVGLSPAAAILVLTLCDHETPLYLGESLDTPELRNWVAFHTGAPIAAKAGAMFALGTWADLAPLGDYSQGTPEYPDRSATLIVEMSELLAEGATLSGPGIKTTAQLSLPDAQAMALNNGQFPLGVDLFLTAGTQLAAVPRSTKIEVL